MRVKVWLTIPYPIESQVTQNYREETAEAVELPQSPLSPKQEKREYLAGGRQV
jgi:hypothetical protein